MTDLAVDGTPLWGDPPYQTTMDRDLRRLYGLRLDHYAALLTDQGGRCAICGKLPKEGTRLVVDEDHSSRLIRGLLCARCNRLTTEARERYLADPPAAHRRWYVPEKQWQTRQARNAGRARRHQAARDAKASEEQPTPTPPAPSLVDRIRDMTQQDPADFQARLREALEATTATTPGWSGGTAQAAATVEAPPREEAPAQRRGLLGRLFG